MEGIRNKHVSLNLCVLIVTGIFFICSTSATPIAREPRQVNIHQKPDGTIVASFAAANSINAPGFDNSFSIADTIEIGPRGSSSSSSSSFNSGIGNNRMSFANSQANSNDLFGGGFSAANAAANSFSNPLFGGSNAQANAFGGNFGFGKR